MHPVTVFISHPPTPSESLPIVIFPIFTLRIPIHIYARCSVKIFSPSIFFLSFIFFLHRNLSHCVGTGTTAIGRRWPRLQAVPSHGGWVARGRGDPPLECGPRVLSSTSSSPVSSDTSFGWCSTHESPRVYLFCAIIIIVFPLFPGRVTTCTRIAPQKKPVRRDESDIVQPPISGYSAFRRRQKNRKKTGEKKFGRNVFPGKNFSDKPRKWLSR